MAARPKVPPAISRALAREPFLAGSGEAEGVVVLVSVMSGSSWSMGCGSRRVAGDVRGRGQGAAEGVVEVDAGDEGLQAQVDFLVLQCGQHELVDQALLAVDQAGLLAQRGAREVAFAPVALAGQRRGLALCALQA